tara:strand:- start:383 stop:703 length:321 start_codon:yes stop_codon:yes gene_type:complete
MIAYNLSICNQYNHPIQFKWNKPDYSESTDPDINTIKRLGRLYYALKNVKKFYSKNDFINDLKKIQFSSKEIKYLNNPNTFIYIENYVKELIILEMEITENKIIKK